MTATTVSVLTMPALDPARGRVTMTVPHGTRISEMVVEALPTASEDERRAICRVTIGDHVIYPQAWHARPRPGTLVVIRVLPTGGLRSILSVVVAISAMVVAPYLGAVIAPAFGFAGALGTGIANSLAAAGVMLAGNLLLNALIPQKDNRSATQSPTYSVSGWRNVENPDGPVPAVLGKHRMAPVIAASTYSEVVGDDQYVRFLGTFGYGPLLIENIRIGDTPIGNFTGVEMEVRGGYEGDDPISLYTSQIIETQLSIELRSDGTEAPQLRRTEADITAFSLDFAFPQGLGQTNDKGKLNWWIVQVRVRYRQLGASTWAYDNVLAFVGKQLTIQRRSLWFDVSRGRYEVELTRVTPNFDDTQHIDGMVWTALRSYRPEAPIAFQHPLALIAVRIKASKQLNGTLDELSADVMRVCLDWDAPSGAWVFRPTRNPASLFRWVAQGPAAAKPRTDAQLDLAGLQAWHEYCTAKGLQYNRVHDYEATEWDVLTAVAAAGRATPRDDGQTLGVVVDRPQTQPIAVISPRNSTNFSWEQDYVEFPDAFRVSFKSELDDYAEKERIVPWPGFTGDPQYIETLQFEGVTHPDQIFRAARRRQLELIYRPGKLQATQELEGLQCARGDLVLASHDVLDRVQLAARVIAVSGDQVRIDEAVSLSRPVAVGARFSRPDGTTFTRPVSSIVSDDDLYSILVLAGAGSAPLVGDNCYLGELGQETFEAVVTRIERGENLTGTIHMVPHAPEIDAILDATPVPAFDGRVGSEAANDPTPPLAPRMSVVSGQAAGGRGEDGKPLLRISLRPAAASAVVLSYYTILHRLAGGGWTSATVSAGIANLVVPGYDRGATVEVKAYGISRAGIGGAETAPVSHVMGSADAFPPSAVEVNGGETAGTVTIRWTMPNSSAVALSRVFRASSGSPFSMASDVSGGLYGGANVSMSWSETPGAGSYDYWVVTEDGEGYASDPAGAVTLTVPDTGSGGGDYGA